MSIIVVFLFGIVSFIFAMSLAIAGVKSREFTPLQRAIALFGAAAFSVPGLMSVYILLVMIAIMNQ